MQIKSRFRFMALNIWLVLETCWRVLKKKYAIGIGTKCFANSNRLQMNANAIILFPLIYQRCHSTRLDARNFRGEQQPKKIYGNSIQDNKNIQMDQFHSRLKVLPSFSNKFIHFFPRSSTGCCCKFYYFWFDYLLMYPPTLLPYCFNACSEESFHLIDFHSI